MTYPHPEINTAFVDDTDWENLPEASFELIPPDTVVPAIAIESSIKTKAQTGSVSFYYTFEVFEGQYKGRKIWKSFTWDNNNNTAKIIGRNEIKKLREAVNHSGQFNDTTQLHNLPLNLVVDIEPENEKNIDPKTGRPYSAKNVIKGAGSSIGILPYEAGAKPTVANNATVSIAPKAPAASKPAWAK